MQTVKISLILIACACAVLLSGCSDELKDLRTRNNAQIKQISELESQLQVATLTLEQLKRKLNSAGNLSDIEADALKQKIAALEEDVAKKNALVTAMQKRLLYGGAQLPVELNTLLEDFAKTEEMVTYDSSRGVVKFKSDLLFEIGSDTVAQSAATAVKALCKILNSEQALKFDIIVAGHTDDMRIGKPETRRKHPTNRHLSSHRAISVANVMVNSKIASERLSTRGFGEFRPIEPNKPNKKGNAKNRRVEIYIVPKGM